MLKYLLLFNFIFSVGHLSAQNQADYWYFGNKAGLNFSTCTPTILSDGQINTAEGVATISDGSGNLLFYTDGVTVWNKTHAIMANGTGLLGHPSATQSAVIVPKPGSVNLYYIFTPAMENSNTGLCFSVVDINRNAGQGEIIEKNTLLSAGITEKVTAVRHANNIDVWIISRVFNSYEYRSWLVSNTGISNPVVSLSTYNPGSDYLKILGYLKPSIDGSKLFCAFADNLYSEISQFNNQTGQVYGITKFKNIPAYLSTVANDRSTAYGVEFSPNGKYMYATSGVFNRNFYLSQYDVSVFDSALIHQSATLIDSGFSALNPLGSEYFALQLAKNGKIYIARHYSTFLSVINQPDLAGTACNLVLNGQHLGTGKSIYGLPTFIQSYFNPHFKTYDFSYSEDCNKNLDFNLITTYTYDSLKWDFGDPASGSSNYSQVGSVSHQYINSGLKTIQLVIYNYVGCRIITDTIKKNIEVGILPPQLGADTVLCAGQSILLNAFSHRADSYLWNTNAASPDIRVSAPGKYWVDVVTGACKLTDTIVITNKPYPLVELGPDTELCEGQQLGLNAGNNGAIYSWQDGSNQSVYLVNGPGRYTVSVNLNGCITSDTINVSGLVKPQFSLGANKTICQHETIMLRPVLAPDWQLLWNDGSNAGSFNVTMPGTYSLSATNICGTSTQAIEIKQGICDIYIPSAFTPNNDQLNDYFKISGTAQLQYFHLIITNRYGQIVFETSDANKNWNGSFKSTPAENGAYIYQLRYRKRNELKTEILKGTVLLIR